jgi:3-deoxy-D-manno-octulosonic-acid transferase
VRLALVSARMTEASLSGWRRTPASARALLSAFDLVLPQDRASEARFTALGARTGPLLNLKLVGEPLPCDDAELDRLRAAVAGRRVILAVSTHPGEEALIAAAFARATAEAATPALLIVAPRHPGRGEAVAAELGDGGGPAPRRGLGQAIAADTRIYVADTLGELGLFLRLADVAVMGGAFLDGVGGHNPLEPARLGVPVVTGPHAFNAREVYGEMFAEAAALEAADGEALARHLAGLLAYPHMARRMGDAALAYAGRQGLALRQAMDLLMPLAPA